MCEKDEDFGMLVGFYDDYRSIKGPILLSFSKQVGKVFPKKCFVYYIVESEDDYVVSILDMVDNVPYIYGGELQFCPDKRYHTQAEWSFIINNQAFVKDTGMIIPFPKENRFDEPFFLKFGPLTEKIFHLMKFIEFNQDSQQIESRTLANEINEITEYVDSLNIQDIINTYVVGSWGLYKCIPGKDNYYCYGNYKRIDTEDSYIKSLFPLEDNLDYYNTDIQGEEEQNFQEFDTIEADKDKEIALQNYSRSEHFAFLLKEFFEERNQICVEVRQKKVLLKYVYFTPVGICNFSHLKYKEYIKGYNEGGQYKRPLFLNIDFIDLISKYDADRDKWMWE